MPTRGSDRWSYSSPVRGGSLVLEESASARAARCYSLYGATSLGRHFSEFVDFLVTVCSRQRLQCRAIDVLGQESHGPVRQDHVCATRVVRRHDSFRTPAGGSS